MCHNMTLHQFLMLLQSEPRRYNLKLHTFILLSSSPELGAVGLGFDSIFISLIALSSSFSGQS